MLCSLLCGCKQMPIETADYNLAIPYPLFIGLDKADPFVLNSHTTLYYVLDDTVAQRTAQIFAAELNEQLGYAPEVLPLPAGGPEKNAIVLKVQKNTNKPDGYNVMVDKEKIEVIASGEAGVFHGLQLLRKSMPASKEVQVSFPAGAVYSEPRFDYRGAHLDVSRHFFPIDSVKNYIDMMALHDMNVLHWHLTDDQGWRLEMKQYPELNAKGSVRKGTMIARDFSSCDSIAYGGIYSQEEAREIVRYAAERFITVIPEIDMPGHMQAALCAYPELGCTGGPYDVWTIWGVSDDVLCAGNEQIYTFCTNVLDEVMDIFPCQYIHIGGDECPKERWHSCKKCQQRIKELGLKGDKNFSAEQKLQSYFTQRIDAYLTAHGRTAIGWDEILEGGASENAIIMSWRGTEGGKQAALEGHRAIMSPSSVLYLNFYQTQDTVGRPMAFDAYCPLSRIYNYDPVPVGLSIQQQSLIMGVQGNMWSEYIYDYSTVQYQFLPRAAALAEIQWNPIENKDYDAFLVRLEHLKKLYALLGYRYCDEIE